MSMIKDLSPDDLNKLAHVLHDIKQLAFYAKEEESVVYPPDEDLRKPPSSHSLSVEKQRFFVFAIRFSHSESQRRVMGWISALFRDKMQLAL